MNPTADNKTANQILNRTLLNTKPVVINSAGNGSASGLSGMAIQFLEDSTGTIVYAKDAKSDDLPTTLKAGLVLYLTNITSVTLTAGSCVVYQS